MKLKGRSMPLGDSGYAILTPEHGEDLWHVYHLVREGDELAAMTHRKVTRVGAKGGDSESIRLRLTIQVEGVDFDAEGEEIRVKGRNLTESDHIRLGAYHTLSITPTKEFKLMKSCWDSIDVDRIKQSCDIAATADLAVLLITDGFGQLFLIGRHATLVKGKIETKLPSKRGAAGAGYEKSWESFMTKAYKCVEHGVNFDVVRCLVIAGPGFAKDTFKEYLNNECLKRGHKHLSENRHRILTVSASTAYRHGLKEVLADVGISSQIQNTKAVGEIKALDSFHEMLASDSARAFYGPGHVFAAANLGAVDALLISDSLFRSSDIRRRNRFVQLVEDVRTSGGSVHIFSMAHVTGEQLHRLSGIAAILRFPLPDLEDKEFDEAELFS